MNGILRKATIPVPVKYLSNFWRLSEMPLNDYKAVLKLERTKNCDLVANFVDNTDADPNNTIFIANSIN